MSKELEDSKGLCFVIMSFSIDPQRLDFYEHSVKPAVEKSGFQCERADEQEFNGKINDKIIDSLRRSKFIIADVTEARPNCYYELGLAHALGKTVIHITNSTEDIHFDINGLNFIVYSRINELKERLEKRIQSTILDKKEVSPQKGMWVIANRECGISEVEGAIERTPEITCTKLFLQERGFEGVEIENLKVVIFSYDKGEDSEQQCGQLINFLSAFERKPLLIIFTQGRVEGADFNQIKKYEPHLFANMSTTLERSLREISSEDGRNSA